MSSTNSTMDIYNHWTDSVKEMHFTNVLLGVFLPFIVFLSTKFASKNTRETRPQLPPGPRPLPLIGNLHQLIGGDLPRSIQRWHKTYGPLISFRVGQRTIISVGNTKVASDLLHKRSAIYSSRPRLIFADEYVTKGLHRVLMPSGELLQKNLWLQTNLLSSRRILSYRHLEDIESRQVLFEMLESSDFSAHFRRLSTSVIWTLVYGKRIASTHAPEIELTKETTKQIVAEAGNIQSGLVETFPFLDTLLPRMLAPWKNAGDREFNCTMRNFNRLSAQASSTSGWNSTKEAQAAQSSHGLNTHELNYGLGIYLEAATETLSSTLDYFMLACILHPVATKRAQAELDKIVGDSRLPAFTDLSDLLYTGAFVKELIRWQPLNPIGMLHAPTQDDEYMGYRIPEGATVLPNNWTLDMDEERYSAPYDLKPERWLGGARPVQVAFGYGRRMCSGQGLAMDILFIMIARMLWAYDISRRGEEKRALYPWNLASGLITLPPAFEARFEVRGEKRREVIQSEWTRAEKNADKITSHIQAVNEQNMARQVKAKIHMLTCESS